MWRQYPSRTLSVPSLSAQTTSLVPKASTECGLPSVLLGEAQAVPAAREPLRPGTSEEELQFNRSVTFRVGLSDAPAKKAAPPQ